MIALYLAAGTISVSLSRKYRRKKNE